MIIHVAGTFGSGKTHICDFFKNLYPANVIYAVDLDDIIHPVIGDKKYNKMKPRVAITAMVAVINKKIKTIIKKHKNVLFAGYDVVFLWENEKRILYRCTINPDHKFFIVGNIDQFIQQYRQRTIIHIQNTTDGVCIRSADEYKNDHKNDMKIYKNYVFLTQEHIILRIIKLIEANFLLKTR